LEIKKKHLQLTKTGDWYIVQESA